jgi:osmotically inducible lipoprotein OsmB
MLEVTAGKLHLVPSLGEGVDCGIHGHCSHHATPTVGATSSGRAIACRPGKIQPGFRHIKPGGRRREPPTPIFVLTNDRLWELHMSRISYLAVCAALALATAACGDTPGQRAVTGGAIGAGGGALVGAAAGGNPLVGAVVGGLGGAAIGAATTPNRNW